MDFEKIFKRLGLPKHSAAIYAFLHSKGPSILSHIAEKVNIHRPATYIALRALIKHHFVFIQNKQQRKYYICADPKIIQKEFTEISEKVLKRFARSEIERKMYFQKEIRFLEGFDGVRAAFDDVIDHMPRGGTFYRYTSEKDLDSVNLYLSEDYRKKRDAKKLERLVISNPVSGKQKRPRLERFVRYIPPEFDLFNQNIIQLVYGNRISFIDLNTKRVLIIENKAMADFQKVIFQQLYRNLED